MLNLLKRKSHLHWHIEYFKQYVREETCPLGLKIQLFPTINDPFSTFKTCWEQTLTQCSVELMKILTTQSTLYMTSLDGEIERLHFQYQTF